MLCPLERRWAADEINSGKAGEAIFYRVFHRTGFLSRDDKTTCIPPMAS
jgi:hypothetical protein